MVAFCRRRSISVAAAVVAVAFGRHRLQVDLLLVAVVVAAGGPDLHQDMVSVEILLVVAVAAGHRWFQLRSRQGF